MNQLQMLNYELFGNSLVAWIASFALFLAVWAALGFLRRIVRKRLLGSVDDAAPPAQLVADPSTVAAIDLVGFLVRLLVWAAVVLVLLDNLGVNVTTLIAGLGVGGIAVALAAQNIKLRFDRAHFQALGESALLFEYVYYVLTADYNFYMDVQQRINLALFEQFAAEGIEFAYPTQTLLISRPAH